jgi:hypothetical protein
MQERDAFVEGVQKESIGKGYDFYRVVRMLFQMNVYNYGDINAIKKGQNSIKIVCSHQIFSSLLGNFPPLKGLLA